MSKIKVKVTFTLEVDTEAWDLDYGTGTAPTAVRDDVKAYFAGGNIVPEHLNGTVRVVAS